jgi:hypothetical protein
MKKMEICEEKQMERNLGMVMLFKRQEGLRITKQQARWDPTLQ